MSWLVPKVGPADTVFRWFYADCTRTVCT